MTEKTEFNQEIDIGLCEGYFTLAADIDDINKEGRVRLYHMEEGPYPVVPQSFESDQAAFNYVIMKGRKNPREFNRAKERAKAAINYRKRNE